MVGLRDARRVVGLRGARRVVGLRGARRAGALPVQQPGLHEGGERAVQLGGRQAGDLGEQPVGEAAADGGGEAGDAARRPQPVQARHQRVLQGVRHPHQVRPGLRGGRVHRLEHRLGHLLDEERDAVAALDDLAHHRLGQAGAGVEVGADPLGLAAGQAGELDVGDVRLAQPGRCRVRPRGHQDQPAFPRGECDGALQQVQRGAVAPMRVFQHQQQRAAARALAQQLEHAAEQAGAVPVRGLSGLGGLAHAHQVDQFRALDGGVQPVVVQQPVQPLAPGVLAVAALEAGRARDLVGDRLQRGVAMGGAAIPGHLRGAGLRCVAAQFGHQPRLADARLARHQHHLAGPGLGSGPAGQHLRHVGLPADQRRAGVRPGGHRRRLERLEDLHHAGEALQLVAAQRAVGHGTAGDALCGVADHHAVRRRHAEQPGGEVRRLSHDAGAAAAGGCQLAHHHQAGGDAHPQLQPHTRQLQPRHRIAQGEAGAHRAGGVVLAGTRKAEIGEHAVAHVLDDGAAMRGDDTLAGA